MAVLVMLSPPEKGKKFEVRSTGSTVLGRDPKCDITIARKSVSRFHAQIISRKRAAYLEDSDSTNGTFLNGNKIAKRTQIRDGDRISLYDIPLVYYESNNIQVDELPTDIVKAGPEELTAAEIGVIDPGSSELRRKLEVFVEIARDLGSSFETDVLFPRILDLLFTMYPQAVIGEIHMNSNGGNLQPVAMKHGRESDSTDLHGAPFNDDLLHEVCETGLGLTRTETSGSIDSAISEVQSTICTPILCHSKDAIGCILLETDDASHPFNESDLDILSAVALLAGQGIGYSRAHDIVLRHAKIERQLETAREIQLSILPKKKPVLEGYEFAEFYSPAERVGGDYYFYENLSDGRLLLGIADASGKGLPAAMNIVSFAGEIRFRVATSRSLKGAMESINRFVCDDDLCSFITACICLIDPATHQVVMMNAGHMSPVLKRDGKAAKSLHTPDSGLPFGVDPDEDYHASTYQLEPGDRILLYTDGISEAMNPRKELYGTERIELVLSECHTSIRKCVDQLVSSVETFREGMLPSDDTTVLAFHYLK